MEALAIKVPGSLLPMLFRRQWEYIKLREDKYPSLQIPGFCDWRYFF